MKTCSKCHKQFKSRVVINGKNTFVGGRLYCVDCIPINFNKTNECRSLKNTIENGISYRVCSKCNLKLELNVDNYGKPKKTGKYYTICKFCVLKNRTNIRKKIKTLSVEYKGGKCYFCGYDRYQGSMDFHHLNPNEKDFSISDATSTQLNDFELIKKELDKCILMCRNCHGEIHGGIIKYLPNLTITRG